MRKLIAVIIISLITAFLVIGRGDPYLRKNRRKIDNSDLSNDKSEYINLADRLYNALISFFTDTDTVFSIVESMKTASDYYLLESVYGKRNVSGKQLTLKESFDKNLSDTWLLSKSFTTTDLQRVKNHIQSLGISYV